MKTNSLNVTKNIKIIEKILNYLLKKAWMKENYK